jgi:hypothetical protein
LEFKIKTVIGFWCISCYASFDCHTTEFLLYLSYLFTYQWQQNLHNSWTLIGLSTFVSGLLVVCLVECLRSSKLRIFRHPWLFICSIILVSGDRLFCLRTVHTMPHMNYTNFWFLWKGVMDLYGLFIKKRYGIVHTMPHMNYTNYFTWKELGTNPFLLKLVLRCNI